MKRTVLLALAASFALGSTAFAAPAASTGGTFYWCAWDNVSSGNTNTHVRLYSQQVDANWDCVSTVKRFDTIAMTSLKACYESMAGNAGYARDVEIDTHNQLLVMGNTDVFPPSRGSTYLATYQQPWDLLSVDATKTNSTTLVNTGRIYTAQTAWDSVMVNRAMRAPANWAGQTSSYVTLNGNYQSPGRYRIFQIWPSSTTDNASSSGRVVYDTGGGGGHTAYTFRDAEFGPDGALYSLQGKTGAGPGRNIQVNRTTWSGSAFVTTTFLSMTGSAGAVSDTNCPGLAIGGTASHPIVYLSACDNVSSTYKAAVFALEDKDGNGVISWSPAVDCITKVWRQGDAKIGYSILSKVDGMDCGIYFEDVEFYNDGQHGYLMFNTYGNGLAVLQLADNGLAGVSGREIFRDVSGGGPGQFFGPFGEGVGFEFDPTPAAVIPEPATLLLVGTGALGALGSIRRQRMR